MPRAKDLSIIIPARNEIFLQRTIEDILSNIEADTEVIAICDGYWPDPPVLDNPRVIVVHHTESIGQRAATNEGARISQAKFIMKVDAHCAFGKGFDRILMEDCQYDWTMIPSQWNLHAFDWKCKSCGYLTYQGAKPTVCKKCQGTDFEMVIVWNDKHTNTVSWRFDSEMHFKYWRKHYKRPECQGDLIETMSCIGACFLMQRKRFKRLGGMDENHGSWGQYGTELACKTWLSGGRMITSKKTFYAHLFRTGNFRGAFGGGSSFPYQISGNAQERAKQYSRDLWLNNKWKGQKYPLVWLINKFWPIPGWSEEDRRNLSMKPFPFSASSNNNVSIGNILPVLSNSVTDGTPSRLTNNLVRENVTVGAIDLSGIDKSDSPITLNHVDSMGDKS